MIDHKLLSSDEIQQRYEQSISIWQSFCGDEPYDFLNSKVNSHQPYQSRSSYDIAAAAQRQRNFNYQVIFFAEWSFFILKSLRIFKTNYFK